VAVEPAEAHDDAPRNQQEPGIHVEPPPVPEAQLPPPAPQAPPVRPARRLGNNDLVIRKVFTNDTLISEVVTHLPKVGETKCLLGPNELTGGAKKWLSTAYNPAIRCLDNHHRGDYTGFSQRWAGIKWNNDFKKLCCGKQDAPCGPQT
jgi:hypothetical protein